jgi:uncharacterized glyoxalase superfamily protein PhnB
VDDAAGAIEFYGRAFGAVEKVRMAGPEGKVMHAELQIGDAMVMLSDPFPEWGSKTAAMLGGSPVSIMLYVERADDLFNRAVQAGARQVRPMEDMFWGDRFGQVEDPYGLKWGIATHVEDVSPEEMEKRMMTAHGG